MKSLKKKNFFHLQISDFSIIQGEECVNKEVFMERLMARGNISYVPPETFTQDPDPPGTAFDVYRWLAESVFRNTQSELLHFVLWFSAPLHIHTAQPCSVLYSLCSTSHRYIAPFFSLIRLTFLPFNNINILLSDNKKQETFFLCCVRGRKLQSSLIAQQAKSKRYDLRASSCFDLQLWDCDVGDTDAAETLRR